MTDELLAAENVETAPQEVEENTEELANSGDETTESLTAEQLADSESDSFIPKEELSKSVEKRINRLTWEMHEAKRESAAKDQKIADLERKLAEASTTAVVEEKAPTLADNDYDDEKYQASLALWAAKKAMTGNKPAQPEPAYQAPIQPDPVAATFLQKRQKYAESNSEYIQLLNNEMMAEAIPKGTGTYSYILSAEEGPKLHHHLLNNPAELFRIQALPDWQQGAELAKIESKLNQVKAKKQSKAPEPVKPVSSGKPAQNKRRTSGFPF